MLISTKVKLHLLQSSGRRHCTLVPVLYLTETLCRTCTVCPGINRRRRLSDSSPVLCNFIKYNLTCLINRFVFTIFNQVAKAGKRENRYFLHVQ